MRIGHNTKYDTTEKFSLTVCTLINYMSYETLMKSIRTSFPFFQLCSLVFLLSHAPQQQKWQLFIIHLLAFARPHFCDWQWWHVLSIHLNFWNWLMPLPLFRRSNLLHRFSNCILGFFIIDYQMNMSTAWLSTISAYECELHRFWTTEGHGAPSSSSSSLGLIYDYSFDAFDSFDFISQTRRPVQHTSTGTTVVRTVGQADRASSIHEDDQTGQWRWRLQIWDTMLVSSVR